MKNNEPYIKLKKIYYNNQGSVIKINLINCQIN